MEIFGFILFIGIIGLIIDIIKIRRTVDEINEKLDKIISEEKDKI